jgi:TatD DNase family protein
MPTPHLIDVHTHTQFAAFEGDQDAVIQRALDSNIWMINVGTQIDTSRAAIETACRFTAGVFAAAGLHPIHTDRSYHDAQEFGEEDANSGFTSRGEEFNFDAYLELAKDRKVVAIGECGLDYYRSSDEKARKKQEEVFRKHIELSLEVKKPLMIHCRHAFGDLIKILDSYFDFRQSEKSGVIHFFSGTIDDAKKLMALGFSFSFGGVITFARDYDEVVRYIPLDRIFVETDAPYVTPQPWRGGRNEPFYVTEVAKKIADIKGVPYDEVAEQTTENAKLLFRI